MDDFENAPISVSSSDLVHQVIYTLSLSYVGHDTLTYVPTYTTKETIDASEDRQEWNSCWLSLPRTIGFFVYVIILTVINYSALNFYFFPLL